MLPSPPISVGIPFRPKSNLFLLTRIFLPASSARYDVASFRHSAPQLPQSLLCLEFLTNSGQAPSRQCPGVTVINGFSLTHQQQLMTAFLLPTFLTPLVTLQSKYNHPCSCRMVAPVQFWIKGLAKACHGSRVDQRADFMVLNVYSHFLVFQEEGSSTSCQGSQLRLTSTRC